MPETPEPRPRPSRDPAGQRVRVGVMGLAVVFLLTLLAASLFTMLGQDTRGPVRPTGRGSVNQAAEEAPKEPLAELGVAPGNAPKTPMATPSAPANVAAASPAPVPAPGPAARRPVP